MSTVTVPPAGDGGVPTPPASEDVVVHEVLEIPVSRRRRAVVGGVLIVLGLLPQAEDLLGALKLVAVWVLVQLAGATVAQLIAHALRRKGPSA